MQVWVKAGAAHEGPGQAGAAHLLEHLVFKGSERRGVGQLARQIEAAGGEVAAWTSHDEAVFHVMVPLPQLPVALDVLLEALVAPSLPPEELERERRVILQELAERDDDPGRSALAALLAARYPDHPYGRPVAGTPEQVAALDRATLAAFHRQRYVAGNMTLVVVGDVSEEALDRLLAGRWPGAFRKGAPAPEPQPLPVPEAPTMVSVITAEVAEAELILGFDVPGLGDPDAPAVDVVAALLGQGRGARLVAGLERLLPGVRAVRSFTWTPPQGGLLVVRAALPAQAIAPEIAAAASVIVGEVARLGTGVAPASDVERARARVVAGATFEAEMAAGQARRLGYWASTTGDADAADRFIDRVRGTTAADVARMAARLAAGPIGVAWLGPPTRNVGVHVRRAVDRARKVRSPAAAAPRLVEEALGRGQLLMWRESGSPITAVRLAWPGGQRLETPATAGIHRLLAGALLPESLQAEVEALGGGVAAVWGRSSFGIRLEVASERARTALAALAAALTHPEIEAGLVQALIMRAERERAARRGDPRALAFRALDEALWRHHPYRLDPLGSTAQLATMGPRALISLWRRHYGLGRATVVIAGDLDMDEARAILVRGGLGHRIPAAPAPKASREPPPHGRVVELPVPGEHLHLALGVPAPALGDADRRAVDLLAGVLAGQSGRLFVALREERALAYQVSAQVFTGVDPGALVIHVACAPAHEAEVRQVIADELGRLATTGPGEADLERSRAWLAGTHALALERRADFAAAIAQGAVFGLGSDEALCYSERLEAVTARQVLAAARRLFDPARLITVVARPGSAAPAAARGDRPRR